MQADTVTNKQLQFLKSFKRSHKKQKLLEEGLQDPELFQFFCDICYNYMERNISVNKTSNKKLKKYDKVFQKLINHKLSKKATKQFFLQYGRGIISLLAVPAISLITSLLT